MFVKPTAQMAPSSVWFEYTGTLLVIIRAVNLGVLAEVLHGVRISIKGGRCEGWHLDTRIRCDHARGCLLKEVTHQVDVPIVSGCQHRRLPVLTSADASSPSIERLSDGPRQTL